MAEFDPARVSLDDLFEDFYHRTLEVLYALESHFNVAGVVEQVLGSSGPHGAPDDVHGRAKLRSSSSWRSLSALYQYAYEGILDDDATDIVIGAAEVLSLVTSELTPRSEAWDRVVRMGDGRFALDEGASIPLDKLALLGNVDPRTVRNAISARELIAQKTEYGLHVEAPSARAWLSKRKGFKPTRSQASSTQRTLDDVDSPIALGSLLRGVREARGVGLERQKLVVMHPMVDANALSQLEQGVFQLPLDAVYAIADFYELNRQQLLLCIMRVFFPAQLAALSQVGSGEARS